MNVVNIELLDYFYDGGNVDWNKSVVGSLDVSNHSEFPLALTFSIADIKDIDARKGTFSKTFKIPATKNNNLLYKNIYIANSYSNNNLTNKKPCRIIFNNLFSVEGYLQLSAVGLKNKPEYYSCVFYGDNIGWTTIIGDSLLKDLGTEGSSWEYLNGKTTDGLPPDGTNGTGINLKINKEGIRSTWDNDDAEYQKRSTTTASTTPIVYPITTYGDFNPDGEDFSIQLLDTWYSYYVNYTFLTSVPSSYSCYTGKVGAVTISNPQPSCDWRPCVWVYDIFKEIFTQAGYTINSTFIESETFKKLLFSLPNFKYNNADDRYDLFSLQAYWNDNPTVNSSSQLIFKNQYTQVVSNSYANIISENILIGAQSGWVTPVDGKGLNGTGGFQPSDNSFLVSEYGKYIISINNMCVHLAAFSTTGTSITNLQYETKYARIQIMRKTVGDSTYHNVGGSEGMIDYPFNVGSSNGGSTLNSTRELPDSDTLIYLNKGDSIKFQFVVRGKTTVAVNSGTTLTGDWYLFADKNISSGRSHNGAIGISIDPLNAQYGQTYDLKNVINKDYKQLDFIKGITHAFNLQFQTNEVSKTVNIEPFNNFYRPLSEAIDWTYKLDRSQDYVDNWLKQSFKRDIVFKYKTDGQDLNVEQRGINYFEEILDNYPYFESFSDEFERGTTTFENPFFAGTMTVKDRDSVQGQTDPPFISALWQEKESGGTTSQNDWERPVKGYGFLPRLLYWKKYSPNSEFDVATQNSITPKRATVQNWDGNTETIIANINMPLHVNYNTPPTGGVLSNVYPQATSVNRDDSTSLVLTYGNVWVRDYTEQPSSIGVYTKPYTVGIGLYERFYKNMIEMIINNPRVRTLHLNLNISDISNLDIKKLVYIDGVYWRINKVIDYKPQSNGTTKVELVEWVDMGVPESTAPTLNQNDGSWNPNGAQTYDPNRGW
jgi:hypothetical protein